MQHGTQSDTQSTGGNPEYLILNLIATVDNHSRSFSINEQEEHARRER